MRKCLGQVETPDILPEPLQQEHEEAMGGEISKPRAHVRALPRRYLFDVKKVHETADVHEVNLTLRQGWKLLSTYVGASSLVYVLSLSQS